MKNLKNMAAAGLMAVMVFGTVSANAGSLIKEETANAAKSQCTVKSGGILQDLAGIFNRLSRITIFDVPAPGCAETGEMTVFTKSEMVLS